MHVDSIRCYCLALPDTTEKLQWGDNLCFKVRGKIFAILGLDERQLCFKCAPEIFVELLERESLSPAPYLGRYKWILAEHLEALRDDEFEDLIRQSYEMVNAKVRKKAVHAQRPSRAANEKAQTSAQRRRSPKRERSKPRAKSKDP
jgi:predicted DNA-binding protein (MmcQ/YjbR family)